MIRSASRSDSAAISRLITESAMQHIVPSLTTEGGQQLLALMDEASMLSFFDDGFQFFVAEVDDELIGVSAVRPPCHLYSLFVQTDDQRTGIGQRLWLQALDWIVRQHAADVVTVNSSLNAVSFYERLGFIRDGDPVGQHGVRYQPMQLRISRG